MYIQTYTSVTALNIKQLDIEIGCTFYLEWNYV